MSNDQNYKSDGRDNCQTPQWKISGVVDSVDIESGRITFWFSGFGELQTVPIVPIMPEWLFNPEVYFYTTMPRACVSQRDLAGNTLWGTFHWDEYSDLSEVELFELLYETLMGQ